MQCVNAFKKLPIRQLYFKVYLNKTVCIQSINCYAAVLLFQFSWVLCSILFCLYDPLCNITGNVVKGTFF